MCKARAQALAHFGNHEATLNEQAVDADLNGSDELYRILGLTAEQSALFTAQYFERFVHPADRLSGKQTRDAGPGRLRDLRSRGDTIPTLIATARDAVVQRIDALNQGADDYLIKPFDFSELFARVRAAAALGRLRAE